MASGGTAPQAPAPHALAAVDRTRHVKYFLNHLSLLPGPYDGADQQRLSLVYFAVSAVDLLGAVEQLDRRRIVDYVYALQLTAEEAEAPGGPGVECCGFRGGTSLGLPFPSGDAAACSVAQTARLEIPFA